MMNDNTIIAGIVAGGSGTRMGGVLPKQFMELKGKPVLIHTVEKFLSHSRLDTVIIGTNPEWRTHTEELIKKYFPDNDNVFVTDGGADRNATVFNIVTFASKALGCRADDIILTHDAVRPFVTHKMIDDSISAMDSYDICTTSIPETDTVVISKDGSKALSFPDRRELYRIQTPQTFRLGSFTDVYSSLTPEERSQATDVCRLYLEKGHSVKLIDGDASNIKLTYPFDFTLAVAILT